MKKTKWMTMGLSAFLAFGLLTACGTSDEAPTEEPAGEPTEEVDGETEEEATTGDGGILVMATSADYPPFESVDVTTGEIVGFDVDIARHIVEGLGYELEVSDMDFSGIIPALQSGRADFALAAMTPTAERLESVDFSDIYYEAANLIIFQEGADIASVEDLAGKIVGVQLASIQEEAASELEEDVSDLTIETRNRIPELIQELLSGRIDAIIIEDTVAKGHLEANPTFQSFELTTEGESGSAIAFPKDSELTEQFNEKLNEMIEDGTLEELIIKWFDE